MKDIDDTTSLEDIFGPVIASYSRAQAIADGVLVAAGPMAQEAGFNWPVALSRAVWEDCVAWTEYDNQKQVYQDQKGRLWDVLFMAAMRIQLSPSKGNQMAFGIQRVPRDGKSQGASAMELKLMVGPGDHAEPVITILLPNED